MYSLKAIHITYGDWSKLFIAGGKSDEIHIPFDFVYSILLNKSFDTERIFGKFIVYFVFVLSFFSLMHWITN